MGRTRARIILGCLALVFGAVAWTGIAPAALGGGVTYATITGNSMEPMLHEGDLVALRAAPPYRVGDVVGYRDGRLGRLVLHRIVARDEAGFTTKGDNNHFLDPTRPTAGDVEGRLAVRVPGAGAVVGRFRAPGSAAVLVGALALLPVGPRRRRKRSDDQDDPAGATPSAGATMDARRSTVAALTVLAVALAALAGYSYSRPTSETVVVNDAYEQAGTFSYRAPARAGAAYPDGVVRTGEAVFPRLSKRVAISFDYRFSSHEASDITGSGALEAIISDGLGWSRAIKLGPPTAFRGREANLTGTLRLDQLRGITRAFERETGTKEGDYSVTFRPRMSVAGRVGGSDLSASFGPSLPMRFDYSRLTVASSPTGEPPALESRESGTVVADRHASLAFGGLSLPVYQARAVGLLGFEIAFGAALLLALPLLMQARRSEAGSIRVRMGGRLVDVAELPWSAPGGCVDLERMSDLARVAGTADLPIMVVEKEGRARYGVIRGDVLYRYATRAPTRKMHHPAGTPMMA